MPTEEEAISDASSAREVVESAHIEFAECRRRYLQLRSSVGTISREFHQRFHSAVLEYYFALREYRDEKAVSEKWNNVVLWREQGEPVRGFDRLSEWIHKEEPVTGKNSTRGGGGQVEMRPKLLPPDKLLRAGSALDDMRKKIGISLTVETGQRPVGLMDQITREDDEAGRTAADGGQGVNDGD